ncbi:DcaP family trimeric outer membrane transporter [Porticoccus sp.]
MFTKKKLALATAVMLPTMAFSGQLLAAASNEDLSAKIQMLESQLQQLQQLVTQQGEQQKAIETTVSKKVDSPVSGMKFSYGGFVKVDAMTSDYSGGERASSALGDEILVPSTIPVGGKDGSSRFDTHAKTSRFWFKTTTPTAAGDVNTHFEMDLLTGDGDERVSNSSHSRIRHAYVSWNYDENSTLLLGQTWSTFMSTMVLPETADFIGPTSGVIFNRQTQARWSHKLGNGGVVHLALENPSSGALDGGSGIESNNFDDNSVPDFVARYDGSLGKFSYNLAGMARQIAYDTGTEDDDEWGYGLSASGKYQFENGDDLKMQLNHGNLGRYTALAAFRDAAVEADGDLDLLDVTGGFVAYRHLWTSKLRSTISYAMTKADNPNSVADTNTEEVNNYALNLFYSPTTNLSFGVEYFKAERELENGDDGDLKRVQFTGKYVFQ